MIFTYRFYCETPEDNYLEVEKCAECLDEAMDLLLEYIDESGFSRESVKVIDWEIVYNEYDAKEYGVMYGVVKAKGE